MNREQLVTELQKLTFDSPMKVTITLTDSPICLILGEYRDVGTRLIHGDLFLSMKEEIESDLLWFTRNPSDLSEYGIAVYKILHQPRLMLRYAKAAK